MTVPETYQSPDWTVIKTERLKALEAVVEADERLIGVLEQTVAAVPAVGNLAIITIAGNAVDYHQGLLAALKELE